MKVEFFVEGEKEIAVGDILTIKVTINNLNLTEKEESGFIHSNKYPFLKNCGWYLLFTDKEENDFMLVKKIAFREKIYVEEIKDMMRMPGEMMINIVLKNDSFKGFDKSF